MKKLLLILALLAYAAISCDKPETTNDEPKTEQPANPEQPADSSFNPGEPSEPENLNADTCSIRIIEPGVQMATFVYNVSSDEVDFEASINSIFRHFTITLNDGTMPELVGTSCVIFNEQSSFDTGSVIGFANFVTFDSLKSGKYIAITWRGLLNSSWGPNHYNPEFKGLYHDITLDEQHTSELIDFYNDTIGGLLKSAATLSFTKY